MSKIFQMLQELSKVQLLSGAESTSTLHEVPNFLKSYGAYSDSIGNLWLEKQSDAPDAKNILLEAHLDAIGLCVASITENGFLSVCACGGFDASLLPGTEFIVHSGKDYKAVATSIPPHLMKKKDAETKITLSEIYLDCGFSSKSEAQRHIMIGSTVSFAAPANALLNRRICAPSLDNKAAVIALLLTFEKLNSKHNVFFLLSMGEETTSRGVKSAHFQRKIDLALVVDAGFSFTKGLDPDKCILMDQGPSISIADTLSRSVSSWVIQTASKTKCSLQTVVEPGGTGTSATALQLRESGIPCGVISIPLKYMHTQSEIVSEKDIELTADLLCTLAEQDDIPFGEVKIVG